MIAPNVLTLEQLNRIALRLPYQEWLGINITGMDDTGLDIAVPWRDEIVGNFNQKFMHGAVLAGLIDIGGFLCVLAKKSGTIAGLDMRVDYHRPATQGDHRIRAEPQKIGKVISTANVEVFDKKDRLIVSGVAAFHSG